MEEVSEMEQEVMAAERAVEDARDKLVAELEAASETGREALERVVHKARPMALAAAAIAGVAVLAGSVALVRRSFVRARPRYLLGAPPQRSLFAQAARQALTSVAATLAATLARRALQSLEGPEDVASPVEQKPNGRAPRGKRARATDTKAAG